MNAHTSTALANDLFLAYAALVPVALGRIAPRRTALLADPVDASDEELELEVTVEDPPLDIDVSDLDPPRWQVVSAQHALAAVPRSDEGRAA